MKKTKIHYAWWIFASCCALTFGFMGCGFNTFGIFVVPVVTELGISSVDFMLYMTLLQLSSAVALFLFSGKLFEKINIRLLLSSSLIIYAGSFFIMSQGKTITAWYLAGIIQGLVAPTLLYLAVPTLLSRWFAKKTGTVIGIALACSGLGAAIANPILANLIMIYGVRMTYILLGFTVMVICLPFFIFIVKGEPADIGLLPYGADEVQTEKTVENNIELNGLTFKEAVKTPSFYLLLLFAGVIPYSMMFNGLIPSFSTSLGNTPVVGATLASTVMISSLLGKVLLGYLNDKIGVKIATSIATVSGILSMLCFLTGSANITILYVGSALFGIAFSILTLQTPLITREIFGQKDFTKIYSVVSTITPIVSAFSLTFLAYLSVLSGSYKLSLTTVLIGYTLATAIVLLAINLGKNFNTQKIKISGTEEVKL